MDRAVAGERLDLGFGRVVPPAGEDGGDRLVQRPVGRRPGEPATPRRIFAVCNGHYTKYRAASFDRIPRTLRFLSPTGIISVTVKDSRRASRIATFFNAVHRFLATGDVTPLAPFRGESFRIGRTRHRFITDPKLLERLAEAGQVSFEEIYANTF